MVSVSAPPGLLVLPSAKNVLPTAFVAPCHVQEHTVYCITIFVISLEPQSLAQEAFLPVELSPIKNNNHTFFLSFNHGLFKCWRVSTLCQNNS